MPWTLNGLYICEPCIWTLYVTFLYTLNEAFFFLNEDKHTSNTTMATRINTTQVVKFDIHDESKFGSMMENTETKI